MPIETILTLAGLVSALAMSAEPQSETGLLILSPTPIEAGLDTPKIIENTSCQLWRYGPIGGSRGALDLGEATHFALLACQGDQTDRAEGRAALRQGLNLPESAVMLEGEFRNRQDDFTSMADSLSRYYVVKIGAFNNQDPDARQAGHEDFMETAAQRPHAFTIDATIDVEWASGMATPDTVEVFFYPDYAESRGFARENEDILSASHIFNAAHFDRFVYFGGLSPEARTPITHIPAGHVLSYVMREAGEGQTQARNRFYQEDRMLGEGLGRHAGTDLTVRQRILGEFAPDDLSVEIWPSQAALERYWDDEAQTRMRSQAEAGWRERRVYSVVLDEDLTLAFDPNKFYTLAAAWFNPDHPEDYTAYLAAISDEVRAAGGRFVYKMKAPHMHATGYAGDAPDQITVVEWESVESLRALQATETYKAASALFRSGTRHFEFFVIAPREQSASQN